MYFMSSCLKYMYFMSSCLKNMSSCLKNMSSCLKNVFMSFHANVCTIELYVYIPF